LDPNGDLVNFDIYMGTTSPPDHVVTQTESSYDPPGDLDYGTTYFWQVVAWDGSGESAIGPIWSFTIESRPNQAPSTPTDPEPSNGRVGVDRDQVLRWSGGVDPDGDAVTFQVYFGTEDPPSLAAVESEPRHDPPGALAPHTAYFWRIVAVDGLGGETSGGTWMFTTGD
jgi:hypothetical protein